MRTKCNNNLEGILGQKTDIGLKLVKHKEGMELS